MIAVVQRVTAAKVTVAGAVVGQIGPGMVALVAVQHKDSSEDSIWLANKLVSLRIFRNGPKHFDLDVRQAGGSVLLVSNFTVAARTSQGRRPSFDVAAEPQRAAELFERLVAEVRTHGPPLQTGEFGADMSVELTNDGPVTVIVESGRGR